MYSPFLFSFIVLKIDWGFDSLSCIKSERRQLFPFLIGWQILRGWPATLALLNKADTPPPPDHFSSLFGWPPLPPWSLIYVVLCSNYYLVSSLFGWLPPSPRSLFVTFWLTPLPPRKVTSFLDSPLPRERYINWDTWKYKELGEHPVFVQVLFTNGLKGKKQVWYMVSRTLYYPFT